MNKLDEILAKSNGLSLITHSKAVAKICELLCNKILKHNSSYELTKKYIILSGLLHDIGKCCKFTQDYFRYNINKKDVNIFHNEISWAFLNSISNIQNEEISYFLNSVYWHHPHNNSKASKNYQDILYNDNINYDDDINLMISLYNELTGDNIDKSKINLNKSYNKTPDFFSNHKDLNTNPNFKNILYRSILISADRIVSSLENNSDVEKILINDQYCLDLINCDKIIYEINKPDEYDNKRFNKQLDCSIKARDYNTTIINATAGFGKTLIGTLWSLPSKNKLLWVCPRNVVVETVYESIIKELNVLNISDISVELYITGERKKCNNINIPIFNSDIIVTNIDNFLKPFISNDVAKRSYFIHDCDVVFDEFHEFIGNEALFSMFIQIMNVRNNLTNSKTLLLSATPSNINFLWDNNINKTCILPNKYKHYSAIHDKNYEINIINEDNIVKNDDTLIITNSIFKAQELKKFLDIDLLVHSKFQEKDKIEKIEKLNNLYGKSNRDQINRSPVVAAPIIQASMDISFPYLIESCCSPETTLQRIGRCNRWGNYNNSCINIINLYNNRSEQMSIKNFYDINLSKLWFNFISKKIKIYNNEITLDELYILYNEFHVNYETEIISFIKNKYNKSLEKLENVFPSRNIKTLQEEQNYNNIPKNGLRNSKDSYYCIYKFNSNNEFTEPFLENVMDSIDRDLKEDSKTLSKIKKVIPRLIECGYKYSKYKQYLKNLTLSKLYEKSYSNETPYIAFNKEYSKEYGLAKKEIYEN